MLSNGATDQACESVLVIPMILIILITTLVTLSKMTSITIENPHCYYYAQG